MLIEIVKSNINKSINHTKSKLFTI